MDIQAVTERLQLLSGETAEQLTRWAPVIASAVRMVELRMFDATDPADERLIHLAAVKALRMLEQSRWFQSGDDVTAFTAGDVTVQQSGQHKASALMLEDEEQACRGLLRDDAFAFHGLQLKELRSNLPQPSPSRGWCDRDNTAAERLRNR